MQDLLSNMETRLTLLFDAIDEGTLYLAFSLAQIIVNCELDKIPPNDPKIDAIKIFSNNCNQSIEKELDIHREKFLKTAREIYPNHPLFLGDDDKLNALRPNLHPDDYKMFVRCGGEKMINWLDR